MRLEAEITVGNNTSFRSPQSKEPEKRKEGLGKKRQEAEEDGDQATMTEEHTCMEGDTGQRGTEKAVEGRKCEADRQGTVT